MSVSLPSLAEPPLNGQEILGLLSARLIHTLSNQLVVITGNICVAASAKHDADERGAALHSALTAANQSGSLLDQLANSRRALHDELGLLRLDELVPFLRHWCTTAPHWSLVVDPNCKNAAGSQLPIGARMLGFIFDSLAEEARGGGEIQVRSNRGAVQLAVTWASSSPIDWEKARTDFSRFRLAATCEILSLLRVKPHSHGTGEGQVTTLFALPLQVAA